MATISTVIAPVGQALADLIEAIDTTPAIKAYWPPRRDLDRPPPAALVKVPSFERRALDDGWEQIGAEDWTLTFGVTLAFELSNDVEAQTQAVAFVEALADAIETDPTLGGLAQDCTLVRAEPEYGYVEESRPILAYECEIQVDRKIAQIR